jgi:hypothetical protein
LPEGRLGVTVALELDRYYTPDAEATRVAESLAVARVESCIDTACGSGSLLKACERVHPRARCIGMDRDRAAIRKLSKERPKWVLTVGDLLRPKTWEHPIADAKPSPDYVLINPPFSMRTSKGVLVKVGAKEIRCSIAMSHLLTTLRVFAPRFGGAAIVPESLMYSELDEAARGIIANDYALEVVRGLRNTTFQGTRANALVVRITRGPRQTVQGRDTRLVSSVRGVHVVRGGLPIFEAAPWRGGVPLLHSTALSDLASGGELDDLCRRVRPIERGLVRGHGVLVPRVGALKPESIAAVHLQQQVQLSDCVIALMVPSAAAARQLASDIRRCRATFADTYRGTGAKFTTMRRLSAWLGPSCGKTAVAYPEATKRAGKHTSGSR